MISLFKYCVYSFTAPNISNGSLIHRNMDIYFLFFFYHNPILLNFIATQIILALTIRGSFYWLWCSFDIPYIVCVSVCVCVCVCVCMCINNFSKEALFLLMEMVLETKI